MDMHGSDMHRHGIAMRMLTLVVVALLCVATSGCRMSPLTVGSQTALSREAGSAARAVRGNTGDNATAVMSMPASVRRALPDEATVLLYREEPGAARSAAFAVVVFAQDAGSRRTLSVLEPTSDGTWRMAASNRHVVACARCGELLDDPLANASIVSSADRFAITQVHGGVHPSSARYAFVRDAATGQWRVGSAEVSRSTQAESGEWTRRVEQSSGASGMAFAAFDPQWRQPEFWNAIVVDDVTGFITSIFNKPDRTSLNAAIGDACGKANTCRTLTLQRYGCLAAAAGSAHALHAAQSLLTGRQAVVDQALAACRSSGQSDCKVVAKGCSVDSD